MKTLNTTLAIALLVFTGTAGAGNKSHGHQKHGYQSQQDYFDYARVIDVRPVYREVKVSTPVRECREVPVYHTRQQQSNSAGGMLAGGLLGGIVGHQFGKGRGKKLATAVGTIVGAQIGHNATRSHAQHEETRVVEYREHCETHQQVRYEEVVDGYDVAYHYRGKRYQVEMPYHPGKRIKMRIQFAPVI